MHVLNMKINFEYLSRSIILYIKQVNSSPSPSQLREMDEVDDSYFLALIDTDNLFPISDEKYADEMQLQEVLMSSAIAAFDRYGPPAKKIKSERAEPAAIKIKTEQVESSSFKKEAAF